MMTLKAGVARGIITPPVGIELSGYAFGPSVGILDDLEAQALVVEQGDEAIALVTADVIGFGPSLVEAVRKRVEAHLGIPANRIVLCASHTHSGPGTAFLRRWGAMDEDYLAVLASKLVGLVDMAQRNVQETRFGAGLGCVDNISENRRAGQDIIDPSVPVLRLDNAEGKPIAVLCNYACHPVSLHSYKNLISPDYPGYMRSVVYSVLGKDVAVMFTLGGAGDINPLGYVHEGTTAERCRQIGAILGCEVAKIALAIETRDTVALQVEQATIDLPVEPLPSPEELRSIEDETDARAKKLKAEGKPWAQVANHKIERDWAREALQEWESGHIQHTRPCTMQAIRLGEAVILALPLEVFVETSLAIKAGSPAGLTIVSSNSNGALGYMPTKHAYEVENDYTNPQGLAPKVYDIYAFSTEAEPLVRQKAGELLKDMYCH